MAEIYPLQVLLATVAGWMNRRQGEILEYALASLERWGEAEEVLSAARGRMEEEWGADDWCTRRTERWLTDVRQQRRPK